MNDRELDEAIRQAEDAAADYRRHERDAAAARRAEDARTAVANRVHFERLARAAADFPARARKAKLPLITVHWGSQEWVTTRWGGRYQKTRKGKERVWVLSPYTSGDSYSSGSIGYYVTKDGRLLRGSAHGSHGYFSSDPMTPLEEWAPGSVDEATAAKFIKLMASKLVNRD